MGRRLVREPEVLRRLAIGKTKLDEDFVKTGKLRWVRLGKRAKAAVEDELDQLVDDLIAQRDTTT